VKPEQALYGVFLVKRFRQRSSAFSSPSLVSLLQPILRTDAPFARGGAQKGRSGLAVA
jgi:hypothetical protein